MREENRPGIPASAAPFNWRTIYTVTYVILALVWALLSVENYRSGRERIGMVLTSGATLAIAMLGYLDRRTKASRRSVEKSSGKDDDS